MSILKKTRNILLCLLPMIIALMLQMGIEFMFMAGISVLEVFRAQGEVDIVQMSSTIYEMTREHYLILLASVQISWILVMGLWYYFGFLRKRERRKFREILSLRCLAAILCAGLGSYMLITIYMLAAEVVMPNQVAEYYQMLEESGIAGLTVMSTISTLVLSPVGEELIFRGLIYHYARREGLGFLAANLLQAMMFGVFHMNWIQGIYAFLLGMILGYFCEKTGSVAAPVVLHAAFNFFGTYLAQTLEKVPKTIWIYGIMLAVGLMLTGAAGKLLKRDQKVRRNLPKHIETLDE